MALSQIKLRLASCASNIPKPLQTNRTRYRSTGVTGCSEPVF